MYHFSTLIGHHWHDECLFLKDDEYSTSYEKKPLDEHRGQVEEAPEEEEFAEEEEDNTESSQVYDT